MDLYQAIGELGELGELSLQTPRLFIQLHDLPPQAAYRCRLRHEQARSSRPWLCMYSLSPVGFEPLYQFVSCKREQLVF